MQYITMEAPGGPEALTLADGPAPTPREGEVLIRVAAAGVNRPDIAQRQGAYPPPPGASPILGMEIAGTIAALGPGVESHKIGDQVCALVSGGGYAEYCAAPAAQCLPIPQGLSLIEAAALPETYFTVWTNVFQRGHLQAGETFLVHGGSSGIGTTAIQLAHQFGARVIADAGTEEKCAVCRSLGAELAINYKTQDFVAEAKQFTEGRGVDLILDMVGGPYFSRNLAALAREGRLVQIAFLQGAKIEVDLTLLMVKRLTVTGSTLRPRTVAEKGAIARDLHEHVWPLLESGKVRPLIYRTFPLADVAQAHALMESSEHIGKIVLTVS
ncbi:MAG: NAD(P)H-quinone oxidoreductase [Capsulimonas sp.]|uniref:NAD(P)H-quinone oxidoreductase n=1 Tax=Capsulimonas sp. TaxID=2494211 RepID=UPI003265E68C